ncbi:hypothetical protein CDO81_06095 [Roseateles puraquae]|uniref:Uncharacterized protein n=1 Tax=Roseateles puraquae TaxID=431059 RepID=A0A254NDG1_9BURK|nr:hypothetical protein CDO81_06095 [Roseateles puraquae]
MPPCTTSVPPPKLVSISPMAPRTVKVSGLVVAEAPVALAFTVTDVGRECGASAAACTVSVPVLLPAGTLSAATVAPAGSPSATRLMASLKPASRCTLT